MVKFLFFYRRCRMVFHSRSHPAKPQTVNREVDAGGEWHIKCHLWYFGFRELLLRQMYSHSTIVQAASVRTGDCKDDWV